MLSGFFIHTFLQQYGISYTEQQASILHDIIIAMLGPAFSVCSAKERLGLQIAHSFSSRCYFLKQAFLEDKILSVMSHIWPLG